MIELSLKRERENALYYGVGTEVEVENLGFAVEGLMYYCFFKEGYVVYIWVVNGNYVE